MPIAWEARWAPEPVCTLWSREKYVAPAGNRTPAVEPVARRYTDCTIPAHTRCEHLTTGLKLILLCPFHTNILTFTPLLFYRRVTPLSFLETELTWWTVVDLVECGLSATVTTGVSLFRPVGEHCETLTAHSIAV
jgi:hypothetical protein